MKTHPPDNPFRQLLRRSWPVEPRPDPAFRATVWARIDATRRLPATWRGWLGLHLARISCCAAASIVFAGISGGLLATTQAHREREQLIQRYVASIDPHQHGGVPHQP
jgi:hypothetical protein